MKNATKIGSTKEHKRQKSETTQGDQLTQNNLTFREAGKKLHKLAPSESVSKNNAYDVLLKRLRSGELCAGFHVTSAPKSWIRDPNRVLVWRHNETF